MTSKVSNFHGEEEPDIMGLFTLSATALTVSGRLLRELYSASPPGGNDRRLEPLRRQVTGQELTHGGSQSLSFSDRGTQRRDVQEAHAGPPPPIAPRPESRVAPPPLPAALDPGGLSLGCSWAPGRCPPQMPQCHPAC